uniref:Uncharacterized protein n=1 Tax=Zea mays TaxID=4577 RepID=B6TH46_MAIZE|nr:hypothetical protein [Zea mays]
MELEVGAPSPARYLVGAAIMMAGVVLPLAYMIFRSKRFAFLRLRRGALLLLQADVGTKGSSDLSEWVNRSPSPDACHSVCFGTARSSNCFSRLGIITSNTS